MSLFGNFCHPLGSEGSREVANLFLAGIWPYHSHGDMKFATQISPPLNSLTPFWSQTSLTNSIFFHLWWKKVLKCWKGDFEQQTVSEAPVCWSKYTTNITVLHDSGSTLLHFAGLPFFFLFYAKASGVNNSKLLASSKKKLGPLLKKQIFLSFTFK